MDSCSECGKSMPDASYLRHLPCTSNDVGYETKFAAFIQMCDQVKDGTIDIVWVDHPSVLGDDYDEIMQSLTRLADASALLKIGAA